LNEKRRIIFGIASGWGSKALNILINLVQIPLLYRYLPTELLGVWFLMIGAQMVVGMFDLGFGQTLQRRIAFAKGNCGSDPDVELDEATRQEISDLLALARRVYVVLSVAVIPILLVGGFFYFARLELSPATLHSLRVAWVIMAIGYAANMWGWFVEATLNGLGDLGWSNLINGVMRLFEFLAIWLVLALGYGLALMALIWVLRGILVRVAGWLVIRYHHPWLASCIGYWRPQDFRKMISPALQWWVAVTSYFFLAVISRYLIAGIMGPKYVPNYVATYTALIMVQSIFLNMVSIATPLLSQKWQAGCIGEMQRLMLGLMRLALGLLTAAYTFICIYGKDIFELWLGTGSFVGYPVLVILAAMMLLEAHQAMLMTACLAAEKLQFYKIVVLGGLISLPLSIWFIKHYGLLGAALGIFISGLLTINWAIPWLSLKVLRLTFIPFMKNILLPSLAIGLSVALTGLLLKLLPLKPLLGLLLYAVCTSLILIVMMYKQISANVSVFFNR
jgi:O-antigen/teichoic acid export membrane protein